MSDVDDAVLAATPVGKGGRQRTPTIALAAGVSVQEAVGVLLNAYTAGLVGRMERAGRETWWRWPESPHVGEGEVEGLFPL